MKIRGVLESCLYAENLPEIERFYSEVLGLEIFAREEGRHAFFRCGEGLLLIFNPAHTSRHQTSVGGAAIPLHGARGEGHIAFSVPEAELPAWKALFEAREIGIESEVAWPSGAISLYIRDPAHNSVELASPAIWGLPDRGGR